MEIEGRATLVALTKFGQCLTGRLKSPVLLVVTFMLLLTSSATAEPLKVGVLYPMSGEYANQGHHSIQGILIAAEETKASSDIELIYEDAGSDSGPALVSAVKNLIEQKKVKAIIGPGMVPQALVVAPITERLGVTLITSALCSPDLLKYKNLVCGYPSTKEQLADLKKIVSKFQIKKLAFVSDASQYGKEVGEILDAFRKEGVFELTALIEIPQATDVERSISTKILASKADAIFATTQSTATTLSLFRRLKEQGFKGTLIGFLDVDNSMLIGFSDSLNGVLLPGYVTSHYRPEFAKAFHNLSVDHADMYAAIGHDMLLTLVESLRKSPDINNIIEGLTQARPLKTALMNFYFNSDRTINLPLEVLEIRQETLSPANLE